MGNDADVTAPAMTRVAAPPEPGQPWGRYTLGERLGAGGMGTVFVAHDPELDREVALKVLHDDDLARAGQERLRREARSLARVTHANVVPVYDVGEHAGRTFYTMERVHGRSLREWARERRGWREVARVFTEVARGLEAIHAAGLVHRDVKPGNILIGDDGRVRVADLGLVAGGAAPGGAGLVDTATLLGAGTLAYMAPEQLDGELGDGRSDQFALGVSLLEVLTGTRPFTGDDAAARRAAIARGLGPPARGVPARLDAIARRALAERPADRFDGMRAIVHALAGVERPPRWRRGLWLVAALAGLGAGGLAVARWPRPSAQHAPAVVPVPVPAHAAAARWFAEARDRLAVDDLLGGAALLDRVIAEDPSFAAAHTQRAELAIWLDDGERARAEARRGLDLSLTLDAAQRKAAEAAFHLASGEQVKGIAIYRELFRRYPGEVRFGLELAANSVTPTDEALVVLAALRALPPPAANLPRLDLIEAIVLLRTDPAAAATAAERARTRAHATGAQVVEALALTTVAAAAAAQVRPEDELAAAIQARALFVAAGLDAKVAWCDQAIADAGMTLGRLDEVSALLEETVRRRPDDPVALLGLADTRFTQGDLDGAAALARRAADQLDREGARAITRADAAMLLAEIAIEAGRPDAAAHQGAALDLLTAPADTEQDERLRGELWLRLADALIQVGRLDEARPLVERAQAAGLQVPVLGPRLRASSGDPADVAAARAALAERLRAVTAAGDVAATLRLRLIGGELEVASGDAATGRRDLEQVARDASARGFGLIARRATRASSAPSR